MQRRDDAKRRRMSAGEMSHHGENDGRIVQSETKKRGKIRRQYERTERIYGPEPLQRLAASRVAVFGLGGVGGYVVEALARSGIGALDLIDHDRIALSNLNRQILATHATLGVDKVDAAAERVREIDPCIRVRTYNLFYLPETEQQFSFSGVDYIVDAVDTVAAKIALIQRAKRERIPILSCMGCGNRVDPSKLYLGDISLTRMDPLAKIMRKELKKRGIHQVKVLCSSEPAIQPWEAEAGDSTVCRNRSASCGSQDSCRNRTRRSTPGSTAFVPPAAGLLIAAEVIRDLTAFDPTPRTKGGRQMKKERKPVDGTRKRSVRKGQPE